MKNKIILIFIILISLSCKQKKTEYVNAKDNFEFNEVIEPKVEKITKKAKEKNEEILTEKISNCELKTLVEIHNLIEKGTELSDQNFSTFFDNMNTNCSDNIEYSEFNNELIFKTLKSNPKKFIAFLSRVSKKKEILKFVLNQICNPINDQIKLDVIYEQLNKTRTEDSNIKKLVSEAIKTAIKNSKE